MERDANHRAVRMIGTNRDIGERKRNELALKGREERLSSLLASMQDAVIVFDTSGKVTEYFQPQRSHRPHDRSTEDCLGKNLGEFLPLDVSQLYDAAIAGIMQDLQPRVFEYRRAIEGRITCRAPRSAL